jgi:hypothetical protein
MPTGNESSLFWGLSAANIIAFLGIIGNFIFTFVKDRSNRAHTSRLDVYNHSVRTPTEALLQELTGLMDEADDIVRSEVLWLEQVKSVKALKLKFHGVRRRLARHLTDLDKSNLVAGSQWSAIEANDMDQASEALEKAVNVTSGPTELRTTLLAFVRPLSSFRIRLKAALDTYASSL